MNGDKAVRILTGLAVLAVAVVAGLVSFSHIETLALAYGYALGTARLLPVSVDGLIVAASLACLTEARAHGEASRLSRAGLVLGILATLAANVAAGAQFGIVGGLVNAWPAIAFIVASEILLRMLRATRDLSSVYEGRRDSDSGGTTPPVAVLEGVADAVPEAESISTLSPVPVERVWAVASGRARGRAQVTRAKAPEKLFAAEIEAGELPSLREVKRRAAFGTDRAREILADLTSTMQEVRSKAAL